MGDTTKRTRPAGRSRSPVIRSTAPRMSPSAGRRRAMSCSPAGVGATLRVVRASRRTPNRSSSPRIAWLTAEVDTPRRFAARVKLRSSATARNADRRLSSSRTICEWYSITLLDFSRYSGPHSPVTIGDRKSTRLNSSHGYISYAVFCLKKKKTQKSDHRRAPYFHPQYLPPYSTSSPAPPHESAIRNHDSRTAALSVTYDAPAFLLRECN